MGSRSKRMALRRLKGCTLLREKRAGHRRRLGIRNKQNLPNTSYRQRRHGCMSALGSSRSFRGKTRWRFRIRPSVGRQSRCSRRGWKYRCTASLHQSRCNLDSPRHTQRLRRMRSHLLRRRRSRPHFRWWSRRHRNRLPRFQPAHRSSLSTPKTELPPRRCCTRVRVALFACSNDSVKPCPMWRGKPLSIARTRIEIRLCAAWWGARRWRRRCRAESHPSNS